MSVAPHSYPDPCLRTRAPLQKAQRCLLEADVGLCCTCLCEDVAFEEEFESQKVKG